MKSTARDGWLARNVLAPLYFVLQGRIVYELIRLLLGDELRVNTMTLTVMAVTVFSSGMCVSAACWLRARCRAAERGLPAIERVPGRMMDALAEMFSTSKAYDTIYKPMLADFYFEYVRAVAQRRRGKAVALRVIYWLAFLRNFLTHEIVQVVEVVRKVVKQ